MRSRSSRRSRAASRTGNRCSMRATRACTTATRARRTDSSRSRAGLLARARIRTPSTTGTGIRSCRARRFGRRSAPSSHLPLAEVLLEAGANPTDGVSAHIAGGGGNIAALELLHRFGVDVNGIPGGVPPLRLHDELGNRTRADRAGCWSTAPTPTLPGASFGDAPLHAAAQRWDVAMVELLVQHGADPHRVGDRRPHAAHAGGIARQSRRRGVAPGYGAKDELSPLDRFVAACARGDRARADAMLRSNPELRGQTCAPSIT